MFSPVVIVFASLSVLIGAFALSSAVYIWLRSHGDAELAREDARERAERAAAGIVAHAEGEARGLLTEAETSSIRLVAERAREEADAAHAYEARIETLMAKLESQLAAAGDAAAAAQQHANEVALARLATAGEAAEARLEASLASLGSDAAARIEHEVAEAFTAVRKTAEAYEMARKAAVDEHISELVSETVERVLGKGLSEPVTVELAQAALEKAKAEHVF